MTSEKLKNPLLTVDVVIICPDDCIIMIKRKNNPYKGFWALPGGFVEYGERVEEAALREAWEETGLNIELNQLLGVYSNPNRDPRAHVVTICYMAQFVSGELKAASDAQEVSKFTLENLLNMELAFDHKKILDDAANIYQLKGN
ncbi:MAG: NUDIX hydrolase [Euryarchaeota archaeon]